MPITECHVHPARGEERIELVWVGDQPTQEEIHAVVVDDADGNRLTDLAEWEAEVRDRGDRRFAISVSPQAQADVAWVRSGSLVCVCGELRGENASCYCLIGSGNGTARISEEIRTAAVQIERASEQRNRELGDLIGFGIGTNGDGGGSAARSIPGGQALVDEQIRRILGRKPSPDDVKGTLALLDRSMERRTGADGIERWVVRRGGATTVLSAGGTGVTGRQASLAGLAHDTVEAVEPIARRLASLLPDADDGRLEARRATFIGALTDAANQASVPGGPIAARTGVLLDQATGQLLQFGRELGVVVKDQNGDLVFDRRSVVTLADEEQFTNFLIVVDRYRAFDGAFRIYLGLPANDSLPSADAQADLGIVLTRMDNRIDVIAEAVDEVDAALDSVGVDHEEREAITVVAGDPASPTVADVMRWAADFPEREARPLIQAGGVLGARLLPQRLTALEGVVGQFKALVDDDDPAPRGLRHPRVRNAVDKLLTELQVARRAARKVR